MAPDSERAAWSARFAAWLDDAWLGSRERLAAEVGASLASVNRWAAGARPRSLLTREAVARVSGGAVPATPPPRAGRRTL